MAQKIVIELSGHDASRIRVDIGKLINLHPGDQKTCDLVHDIEVVLFGNGFL